MDAWFDFHADGRFDPVDQVFARQELFAGSNTLCFTSPADLVTQTSFARFRFSAEGGYGPTGEAVEGEVEDYILTYPLPVELTRFEANPTPDQGIQLEWTTATETENAGFEIQHHTLQETGLTSAKNWETLQFITGAGTTTEAQDYHYIVPKVTPGLHRFKAQAN